MGLVGPVGLVRILCDFLGSCHSKFILTFRNVAILSHLSGHVGRVGRLEHTDTTHFAGGLHLFCGSDSSGCGASNDQKHGKTFACLGDQCLQCINNQSIAFNIFQLQSA